MERHATVLIWLVSSFALWIPVIGSTTDITQSGTSTTNYAVDLYSQAKAATGPINITPIMFGSSAHTIEIQSFSRIGSQCVMSMGTAGTANYFAIQEDSGYVIVRLGFPNLLNFRIAVSKSPIVSYNTWNTFSVVIKNINSANALVSVFVNGTLVIDNATTLSFPAGLRGNVTIGDCQYRPDVGQPQGPQTLSGIVDNFRVWNTARTASEIQSVVSSLDTNDNLTSVTNNYNLIAFYPFTEGRGSVSRNLAPGSNGQATFTSFWAVKYLSDLHRICASSDSNVLIRIPDEAPMIYDPPQLLGQWQQSSCGQNFIVRVYRAPRDAWSVDDNCDVVSCGPTIINAITVKAFDEVFYVDVSGNLTVRNLNGVFAPLGHGSGTRPSGVHYVYRLDRLLLEVPTVGFIDIGFSVLERGGIQSSPEIQHTTYCESISGVTGLCDNIDQRVSWNQFLFLNESFCGDQYVSGLEQCDGSISCSNKCTCAVGTNPEGGLCLDVCGNGILTGTKQCDKTYGCTSECKCKRGTKPENGKCVDICSDGFVTGAEQCDGGSFCNKCMCLTGYKPTSPLSQSCELIPVEFVPRVVPSLDCVDFLDTGVAQLYFSYDNLDGFEQTIEHGKHNDFTPESIATTRPTVFSSGQSLTYPLSPYIMNISTSTIGKSLAAFTWILGSFDLTVELAGLARLQCPEAPAIEIELSTSVNLTSDIVQTIIDNLAEMYDIDPLRINVTVVVNSTTLPPTYTLIIVINNPTNSTERDSIQVIIDLFSDLKENEDETRRNLTEGLDADIKQITTRPTGVEVRGQTTDINGDTRDPFKPVGDALSGGISLAPAASLLVVLCSIVF